MSRAEVLSRVKAGGLSLVSAATMLAVSYRQAKRLLRRYRRDGAKGLRHASVGRASNRTTASATRQRALALIRQKYCGPVDVRFGPTLAAEHLAAEDGLPVDHERLRRWMLAEGLWSRARTRSPHRQRRERKAHFGELVQLDGSVHARYEDRVPRGCLVTLVADATGQTLGRLGAQETIWAAADVVRRWIERYGVPHALYTDWKNVYVRPRRRRNRQPAPCRGRSLAACARCWASRSSPRARRRPRGGSSATTGRIRTGW